MLKVDSSNTYVKHLDMSERRTEDLDPLLALFFFAWRGFASEPDAILEREGLGRVHHRILYTVVHIPGVRVGDLAATLGVTRQALHRPLSDLQKRRLVTSEIPTESARERALYLTERGARLEARASGAQREQLGRIFAEAGPKAAEGWVRVMRVLAAPVVSRSPRVVAEVVRYDASDDCSPQRR
jgi:DNA-binding MarR family transcriptional regulator